MEVAFGITGKDYVIFASDTSAARSIVRMKSTEDKQRVVGKHLVMAYSGEPGDTVNFAEYVERNLRLYTMRNHIPLRPSAVAAWTRNSLAKSLRSRKPYSVNLLMGGYDTTTSKPELYWIDYLGTMANVPYAAHGYGAYFCLSTMDRWHKADMTLEEGIELLRKCVDELSKRFIVNLGDFTVRVAGPGGVSNHLLSELIKGDEVGQKFLFFDVVLLMASVNQIVQGFLIRKAGRRTLTEHRVVQPICTAYLSQSWDLGLELCEKALQKQVDSYSVLALSAIGYLYRTPQMSLESSQKIKQAIDFLHSSNEGKGLGDSDVIRAFIHVLETLGEEDQLQKLLASALEKFPNNETVVVQAMNFYVGSGDRQGLQKAAIQFYQRLQTAKPFSAEAQQSLWWALVATILKIENPEVPQEEKYTNVNTQELKLLEKEVSALFNHASRPDVIKNNHLFHLITRFVDVLARSFAGDEASELTLPTTTLPLTRHQQVLAHLEGCEEVFSTSLGLEIYRRELEFYYGKAKEGAWNESSIRLKHELQNGDTNWHTMLYLIRNVFAHITGSSEWLMDVKIIPPQITFTESQDTSINELRMFFQTLDANQKGKSERGYLLAVLYIDSVNRKLGLPQGSELFGAMEVFMDKVGNKACCYDDLLSYFDMLTPEEVVNLQGTIQQDGDLTEKTIQYAINSSKVLRYLNEENTLVRHQQDINRYLTKYFEGLPLGDKLPATEIQPADDFALLAAQTAVSAWSISKQSTFLDQALLILAYASSRSQQKFQHRLLAINILRLVGASSLALAEYDALNIKSVQFDTLSHVGLSRVATFAFAGIEPLEEVEKALSWYSIGESEAKDMSARVFSYHNFTRVEDFSEFRTRLTQSLSKGILLAESLRIKLLRGVLAPEDAEQSLLVLDILCSGKLFDNRDFGTLPNWQPRNTTSIVDQTMMGGPVENSWIYAFYLIYSRLLKPSAQTPNLAIDTAKLLPLEQQLLGFSENAHKVLYSGLEESPEEKKLSEFFKNQEIALQTLLEDDTHLLWQAISISQITFEAFCLLEFGIQRRIEEIQVEKPPEHARLIKKIRGVRLTSKEAVKKVGMKLNGHAKQVAKEEPTIAAGLEPVTTLFDALDFKFVSGFTSNLAVSRKSAAETLSSAIHRRCNAK